MVNSPAPFSQKMLHFLSHVFSHFRRLFPVVLVTVKGLNPSVKYTIKVRFVSADKYRHKFLTGRWTAVGESDIMQDETRMAYSHPTSPNTGEYWMKKPISFKCIKVTHHSESKNGNVS